MLNLAQHFQGFIDDDEGRSAVGFTIFVFILLLSAGVLATFIMTNGDPMGAYESMTTQMYWSSQCEQNVPGACQMAKIQW